MKEKLMFDGSNNHVFEYFSNIQDVIAYIVKNKKELFYIMDNDSISNVNTYAIKFFYQSAKEKDIKLIFFDENHECFKDSFDNLYFTPLFYEINKDIINNTIVNILLKEDWPHVSKYVYSDELAKMLCQSAKTITFGEGINLPSEIINLYKRNRINVYVKKDNETVQISSSEILGQQYESVISDSKEITLKDNITDFENLKYIPSNKDIIISCSDENYDNVYNIISKLIKIEKTNNITLIIPSRSNFVKTNLFKSDFDFNINDESYVNYTHKEMIEEEKLYDLIVNDINSYDYSQFEKYLACYNVVKKFKEYKESPNDKNLSRNLKYIFNNDYMVCVGYAKMLEELLSRIGINSYHYSVGADDSYDQGFSMEEKKTKYIGHARVIVYINDPKYDINGFYVADPTWDNDLEKDYYNHALISFDKTCNENRFLYLMDEDLIMNVKNMEEFSERINYCLKSKISKNNFDKDYNEKLSSAYKNIISRIMNILEKLLPEKYNELSKKYTFSFLNRFNYRLYDSFLTEAGNIFVEYLGRDVSIEEVIEASVNLNVKVFGITDDEKIKIYKEKLLEENLERDKKSFPQYYMDDAKKIA